MRKTLAIFRDFIVLEEHCCPECLGNLDHYYECVKCGYDASEAEFQKWMKDAK